MTDQPPTIDHKSEAHYFAHEAVEALAKGDRSTAIGHALIGLLHVELAYLADAESFDPPGPPDVTGVSQDASPQL